MCEFEDLIESNNLTFSWAEASDQGWIKLFNNDGRMVFCRYYGGALMLHGKYVWGKDLPECAKRVRKSVNLLRLAEDFIATLPKEVNLRLFTLKAMGLSPKEKIEYIVKITAELNEVE